MDQGFEQVIEFRAVFHTVKNLIKDQNSWPESQSTGQHEPVGLARSERSAPCGEFGLQAFRQALDCGKKANATKNLAQLGRVEVGDSKQNVFFDSALEDFDAAN